MLGQSIPNIRGLGQGHSQVQPCILGMSPTHEIPPIVEQEKNIIMVFIICTPQGVGEDDSYTYSLGMEGSINRHNFHPTLKE
jgi:hypothetical protein